MTVVRSKQRTNAGQLADYLTRDPTAELGQVRGVIAASAQEAIAELSLLAAGSRSRAELFHASINPNPRDPAWAPEQFTRGWEVFEQVYGLGEHAYAEVYHSDDGRLHVHRVYAVVRDGRAAKLSWSKITNELVGRHLEFEFGHQFVPGPNLETVLRRLERSSDPQQRAAAAAMREAGLERGPERAAGKEEEWEKEQGERTAVSAEEVSATVAEAWKLVGGEGERFQGELRRHGLALAQGDRGLLFVDWAGGVHPAGRRLFAGLSPGEGRAASHQEQAALLAAVCSGPHPTLGQVRARLSQDADAPASGSAPRATRREKVPAQEKEPGRLALAAWEHSADGTEFIARLADAGLELRPGEKAGHWVLVSGADPDQRKQDLVRILNSARRAAGVNQKSGAIRSEVAQRLADLTLPSRPPEICLPGRSGGVIEEDIKMSTTEPRGSGSSTLDRILVAWRELQATELPTNRQLEKRDKLADILAATPPEVLRPLVSKDEYKQLNTIAQRHAGQVGEVKEQLTEDSKPPAVPGDAERADQRARRCYDELASLPVGRLTAIATGQNRGHDSRLWSWRWGAVTDVQRAELEAKIRQASQVPAPLSEEEEKRSAARSRGAEREMPLLDRLQAYRLLFGERAKIEVQGKEIHVVTPKGLIRDDGGAIRTDGPCDSEMARRIIEMSYARGWREVRLTGSEDSKREMARAAVDMGIKVVNPELAEDVERYRRELVLTSGMRVEGRQRVSQPVEEVRQPAQRHDPRQSPASNHLAIERYAGQEVDQALTRDVETVQAVESRISIGYAGGTNLTHARDEGGELRGTLTAERARLMAELCAAQGEKSVLVSGTPQAKELMAWAAIEAGLDVSNVELRELVAEIKRQQEQTQLALMRPDRVDGERQRQSPERSEAAIKAANVARAKRELAAAESPVERMRTAGRLAELAQDEKTFRYAADQRLAAAQKVLRQRLDEVSDGDRRHAADLVSRGRIVRVQQTGSRNRVEEQAQ